MWAYRGVNVKLNVFDFTVSRHRDGPELFFEEFYAARSWVIVGTGSARLRQLRGAIVRAACNAHARRKFENATDYPADRKKWMDWFWLLYDLESEAREQSLTGDALLASRRAQQKPVWDQMRAELDAVDDRTQRKPLTLFDLATVGKDRLLSRQLPY